MYREKTFPPPVEVKAINAIIKQATLEFDLQSTHHLAKGDAIAGLDTVQRHSGVLFCRARITDEWDMLDILNKSGTMCTEHTTLLWQGMKDPSVYYKVNVEDT
ncbi:hypothetical protein BKA82DRAFT_28902 [Pisolithus tinctorius]|uniref:Uncharacterized protein n=1 Tax=Pisolithus tinctorius Marx 270 TaxID=870435 RepID=A0A0C3JUN7_PISTI|nr:hypothetical protein BKA82DRAFT_28902 [Pisolithus tinctorius]KIO01177.1 hypothetical protein M404DRAFT_28902 [Pisolithus tinctorius Marx 270]